MTHRRHISRPLILTLALIALTLLALQGPVFGNPPDGAFSWEYTAAAQARTAAGECYDPNATVQEVCVQFCVVTQDGHVLPQNEFRCMPFFY